MMVTPKSVITILLLVQTLAAANVYIPPDLVFNHETPVKVVLSRDTYTHVLVLEGTNVLLDCSPVRNIYNEGNTISNMSSVKWVFQEQDHNLTEESFQNHVRVITDGDENQSIRISGQFNEFINISAVLPSEGKNGTTGRYACSFTYRSQAGPSIATGTFAIPIFGKQSHPPDINEGDPGDHGGYGFRFKTHLQEKIGTNVCIESNLSDSIQIHQETILLRCQHNTSAPQTTFPLTGVWFLNGVQISSSTTGLRVPATPDNIDLYERGSELRISNLVNAIRGNYTCQLINVVGEDSATSIIRNCSRPPVIGDGKRFSPSTISIGFGPHCLTTPKVTIMCLLESGDPPIAFSWSRDGTSIPGATESILEVSTLDVGEYRCIATNLYGTATAVTQIEVPPCIAFIGFISKDFLINPGCNQLRVPPPTLPDVCAYVGDTVQLECKLGTVAGSSVSALQITSPQDMAINTGLVITSSIDIVEQTSGGVFHCSFSRLGLNKTVKVEVFDPPVINTTIPELSTRLSTVSGAGRHNLTVIPGTLVILFCPASGIPPANITWTRLVEGSYVPVNTSDDARYIVDGIPNLTLRVVQQENFTRYKCTAENMAGIDTKTVDVRTIIINGATSLGPPTGLDEDNTIIIGDSTCIPINGSVYINCSTYQSNLVYQWSKDGEVVTNPNPPNILNVTQRGNYTCTATNSASTESATSWIEVIPPSISFKIVSISVIECSRLNPIPANVTQCPRLSSRVDFNCTIDIPGQTPLITFNGTPLRETYIESFTTSNNGVYQCSFQNTCGTSTEVDINVQAFQPARVDITTDLPLSTWSVVGGAGRSDIRVNIGGNVTLYCPTTGIDTPNTRWLLNGTTMVSNLPRVVITNETVNDIPAVVLTISNITTSDLVTYTCVTSNSDGTDTQNITIRDIASFVSTSRILCGSSCLATSAANLVPSNAKPSSLQVIVSPSIPALESVPITTTVISSTIGGILIFIFVLVAVTIFIVLRAKWQRKKIIDVLEQDFQRRTSTLREQRYGMPFGHVNDGFGKITSVPQIRPETLPLIGSAIILGRDIQLMDKIGQGEFGVVYKANFIGYNNGRGSMSVAVKTMQACCTEDELKAFLDESLKMKELCHPNVMNLLGVCLDAGPTPYIVLPFMENGDLLSYIKKRRESLLVTECDDIDKISEVRIKLFSMCLQISKGMEYLASQNIIHRDLAARNCMIDGGGMVKVADFGLSKSTYEKLYFRQEKSDNVKLPIKWLAVESIEDGVFSEKSDVWAFGVTCWEVFSGGKMPYGGLSPLSLSKLLKDGERMEAPDNAACSQEIYQTVMYQCWHGNPDERPTFSQLQIKISAVLSSMADYLEFSEIAPCDEIDEEKIGCQEFTIVASSTPSTPDRKTSTGCLLKPRDC